MIRSSSVNERCHERPRQPRLQWDIRRFLATMLRSMETMRTLLIVSAAFRIATLAAAQSQRQLNLMPMPTVVQFGTGQLAIDRSFSIAITGSRDTTLERGVQRFATQLSQETGMLLKNRAVESGKPSLLIHAEHGHESVQSLGEDESYELTIEESGAKLSASNSLGVLRGLQPFLQPAGTART